jgi:hypothetical protein
MTKETESVSKWITVGRPGYLGKNKDTQLSAWDQEYGPGNWRLTWETATGEVMDYDTIFLQYIDSYYRYFQQHLDEAIFLTDNYSYAYDKELISREEAFDPHFLFEKPGHRNQFHNVALNLALEQALGLPFKGTEPIQVREGKPGTDPATWPAGWRWSPGRIPASHPELIPKVGEPSWWNPGSVEHLYQASKVIQIKK